MTVSNSQFSNFGNGALNYDSADGGLLTVSSTEFLNNSKSGSGAAILAENVSVAITGSYFANNVATNTNNGGAIAVETTADVTISNTTFYQNSADRGGAVYASITNGTLNISNVTFYENTAETMGGALAIFGTGTFTVSDATFANNTVTSSDGVGSAIYNDIGSLTVKNSLLIGDSSTDVLHHQELGGKTTLEYSFATSSGGAGNITLGTGSEIDSAFTSSAVFGDNTYDTTTHTIAPDAFHKVSWSGTKLSDYDQNGNSRDAINTVTGLTGKYSVGAVTAAAGLQVVQNDYSTPYTGMEITPEEHLSLLYADGTVLTMSVTAALTAAPAPVKDIGIYTITPSKAYVAALPADAEVVYAYTPGTLTVYNWGDLIIQENNFTHTYSETMPLQSQYTFVTEDLRTADATDTVTITVSVQWQIIDGKVTGIKAGTAIITVTTVDGGFTDTCTVTVK